MGRSLIESGGRRLSICSTSEWADAVGVFGVPNLGTATLPPRCLPHPQSGNPTERFPTSKSTTQETTTSNLPRTNTSNFPYQETPLFPVISPQFLVSTPEEHLLDGPVTSHLLPPNHISRHPDLTAIGQ